MTEEECGWEEVYRAYGCSPLYAADREPVEDRRNLNQAPPLVELIVTEVRSDSLYIEEISAPVA